MIVRLKNSRLNLSSASPDPAGATSDRFFLNLILNLESAILNRPAPGEGNFAVAVHPPGPVPYGTGPRHTRHPEKPEATKDLCICLEKQNAGILCCAQNHRGLWPPLFTKGHDFSRVVYGSALMRGFSPAYFRLS